MADIDERLVFSYGAASDGAAALMIGLPQKAWKQLQAGKTHNLDLSSIGIPIKLVIFGGENHDACIRVIQDAAKQSGAVLNDLRRNDFSIKPKG